MKRCQRFTAGESNEIPIGLPVVRTEPFDVLVEREAITFDTGVMLTEPFNDLDVKVAECRRDDLGSFTRPRELTTDQHVRMKLAYRREPMAQARGLFAPQR